MIHGVLDGDALKIEDLASAQDGGEDFMFFGGSQDEDSIGGWFFQGLQECVEGGGTEHVYLIYDIDFIFTGLRSKAYLFYEGTDVVY